MEMPHGQLVRSSGVQGTDLGWRRMGAIVLWTVISTMQLNEIDSEMGVENRRDSKTEPGCSSVKNLGRGKRD